MQAYTGKVNEYTRIKDRIEELENEIAKHECPDRQFVNPSRSQHCVCSDLSKEIDGLKTILKWFEIITPKTPTEEPNAAADPFHTAS